MGSDFQRQRARSTSEEIARKLIGEYDSRYHPISFQEIHIPAPAKDTKKVIIELVTTESELVARIDDNDDYLPGKDEAIFIAGRMFLVQKVLTTYKFMYDGEVKTYDIEKIQVIAKEVEMPVKDSEPS